MIIVTQHSLLLSSDVKPRSAQVNGRLSACSASSGPVEGDCPAQRKQYNSPIGLYSEQTLREMAAAQAGRPAGYVETERRKHGGRLVLRGGAALVHLANVTVISAQKPGEQVKQTAVMLSIPLIPR